MIIRIYGIYQLGFGDWGLALGFGEIGVWGLGFRVWGDWGLGFRG